ncbi:MAG: hypothetical protein Q8Q35_00165 [Nanoarchaeota archaeon]|nr:hypothetical protein [Nanoarchaeota archaeon]
MLKEDEGLSVARSINQSCPYSEFICWTGYASIETYRESRIEDLASSYIEKTEGGFEFFKGENNLIDEAWETKKENVTGALRLGTPHLYALVGGRYAGKSDISIFAANAHPTIVKQKSLTDRALRTGSDAELWKDMREKEVVPRSLIEKRRGELVVLERKGDDYVAARDPEEAWDLLSKGYDVLWVVGDPDILPDLKEKFGSFYRGVRLHVPLTELEERMRASKRGSETDREQLLEKIIDEQREFQFQPRPFMDLIHHTIPNSAISGLDDVEAFVPSVSNLINYINSQR